MGDLPQYFKFVRWMLTSSLNLKTVSLINDVVRLGELRVFFKITFRGHELEGRSFYLETYMIEYLRNFSR